MVSLEILRASPLLTLTMVEQGLAADPSLILKIAAAWPDGVQPALEIFEAVSLVQARFHWLNVALELAIMQDGQFGAADELTLVCFDIPRLGALSLRDARVPFSRSKRRALQE